MPTQKRNSRRLPFQRARISRDDKKREKSNYDFYNSYSWRKYSVDRRKRNPECQSCHKLFQYKELVTDHIIPINNGGSKMDARNHQSLCKPCHAQKSAKESNGIIQPYKFNTKGEKIPQ